MVQCGEKVRRELRQVVAIFVTKFSSSLASSFRRYSSRPFHPFASVVEQRIISEVSLYGLRPGAGLGAWPSLLSRNRKDSCRRLSERAGSKQPEVSDSVLIPFRDVLGPAVNELF
jgi:hypothetical protein